MRRSRTRTGGGSRGSGGPGSRRSRSTDPGSSNSVSDRRSRRIRGSNERETDRQRVRANSSGSSTRRGLVTTVINLLQSRLCGLSGLLPRCMYIRLWNHQAVAWTPPGRHGVAQPEEPQSWCGLTVRLCVNYRRSSLRHPTLHRVRSCTTCSQDAIEITAVD